MQDFHSWLFLVPKWSPFTLRWSFAPVLTFYSDPFWDTVHWLILIAWLPYLFFKVSLAQVKITKSCKKSHINRQWSTATLIPVFIMRCPVIIRWGDWSTYNIPTVVQQLWECWMYCNHPIVIIAHWSQVIRTPLTKWKRDFWETLAIPSLTLDPKDYNQFNVRTPGCPWGPIEPWGFHAIFLAMEFL